MCDILHVLLPKCFSIIFQGIKSWTNTVNLLILSTWCLCGFCGFFEERVCACDNCLHTLQWNRVSHSLFPSQWFIYYTQVKWGISKRVKQALLTPTSLAMAESRFIHRKVTKKRFHMYLALITKRSKLLIFTCLKKLEILNFRRAVGFRGSWAEPL